MSSPQISPKETRPREQLLVAAVFVVTAGAMWLLWANRFFLSLDEGIYLAGAERLLRGQVPYRDFFVITGPGSFWIQAGILGLLGPTLRNARLALVFDLAVLSAAVYWLTTRLAGRNFGLVVTTVFFALETRPLFRLYVNHRWDSSAFAILAVVFVFAGTENPCFQTFLAAGIAAAAATWITPSLLALLILLAIWTLLIKDLRRQTIPYLAGIMSVSLLAGGVLFFQGALAAMFRDLLWTSASYPAANRVPYGYGAIDPGGLRAMFAGAEGAAFIARTTGMVAVLAPVVLPVAVYVGWMVRRLRRKEIDQCEKLAALLMLASFGFVISSYPRWSADQLLFIVPVFYVLAAYLLGQALTGRIVRVASGAMVLGLAAAALSYSVLRVTSEPVIETHVGVVRAGASEQSIIRLAGARIKPGDTLFVYPYLPIVYFLTGTENPTPYSFLQPGMMQPADYNKALSSLRAHPPKWGLYFAFPLETYHGIWPAADPRGLNLTPVDHFILSNYHPVGILQGAGMHFFLLEQGSS
ncbi:MAG: hypothetical protein EPN47_08665 [Acidobacteria bacterium]|nr:MAG: hypothetical protein EPN47_08665 [Acidobacteriota bacterium]